LREIPAPPGALAKDAFGNLNSIQELYVPLKLEEGTYDVTAYSGDRDRQFRAS
jgi:hypothetical protein